MRSSPHGQKGRTAVSWRRRVSRLAQCSRSCQMWLLPPLQLPADVTSRAFAFPPQFSIARPHFCICCSLALEKLSGQCSPFHLPVKPLLGAAPLSESLPRPLSPVPQYLTWAWPLFDLQLLLMLNTSNGYLPDPSDNKLWKSIFPSYSFLGIV